jgi:O-antigen ligase
MTERPADAPAATLRTAAVTGLILVVVAVQFSIGIAHTLLGLTTTAWLALLVVEKRRPAAPRFMVPLLAYAGLTLISAAFSSDPTTSLIDCKQLVLLLIVPMTYDLVTKHLAGTAATAVMSAGAVSGLVGIGQYAILNYNLDRRPHGTLGMYMTFSGLTMLVVCLALSQVLFARRGRTWPALIVPALSVALVVSFSRNAWIGACAALAVLLIMKNFRLLAILPVIAAVFFAAAPAEIQQRFFSIFDLNDATSRDRLAMLQAGQGIVRDHPLMGVGPDMLLREYPSYRRPGAVLEMTPHLHNVPMQIAAERGLPALAAWLWFVGVLIVDLWRLFRSSSGAENRWLPAAGLASVVAMLTAGQFEYNFGDSEFLMLFLFLITVPFAARTSARSEARAHRQGAAHAS